MIIVIVGNQGSGKTLLLTQMLCWALEKEKKNVFATYHVTHRTYDGEEVHFVDFSKLFTLMDMNEIVFPQNTCAIGIDEAYKGLDSRMSSSDANIILTEQLNEARKRGFDVFVTIQLNSRLDKSIRSQAEIIVLAEVQPAPIDSIIPKKEPPWPAVQFVYTLYNPKTWEEIGVHVIQNEQFRAIAQCYDTQEIVKPPDVSMGKETILAIAQKYLGGEEDQLLKSLANKQKPKEAIATTPSM